MGKQGGQPFLLGVAMKKIRIVVADHEKSYIESFSAYLRNSEEANRFIPTYFTSWNVLREFLDSNGIMDILLISPKLYDDSLKIPEGTTLIFLEDEDMDHEVDSSRQSVYRYQRLDNLLSNLLSIYYENNQQASKLLARSKKTKVLTVYSPVGGSGKTTLAVNLSKQLALNHLKVFYLNLELLNSTSLYFISEEDSPSLQIFYYVKSESEQLLSKIEALRKYDPHASVYYFDVSTSAVELLELTSANVKRLIDVIIESGAYDYIIVDLDSSIHERNIAAIQECNQLIWPVGNDEQSFFKTKAFFDEEEELFGKENIIKDKVLLVMNKFNGHAANFAAEYELSVDAYFPFIESWVHGVGEKTILENDAYNQDLQSFIQEKILHSERDAMNIGLG